MDDEIFDLIYKLEKEGNYEEALRHLEIAFEERLGSFDIRNDMGRIYNKMRNFDEALSCFEIVLEMDDSNPEYLFGKGISLIGLNRFDGALDVFGKLTETDEGNANAWYYKSILAKSLGNLDANKYFDKFLKYDDGEFREIRSYYRFGIQFDEIEHNFRKFSDLEILSELKEELISLNLDDNQYSELVRLTPLENLFDKVIELKESKFGTDTEDIIRREFKKQGLTDNDVDDLFKIETIENLKQEVIELCDENPFSDSESYSNFIPLTLASKYNAKPRMVKKHEDLKLFNRGNMYFDYNQIQEAIEVYDKGLEYNPDNLLLKFVKCCANYRLGGDSNV
jgi:tetratricopeptide (TPR) repeat protein